MPIKSDVIIVGSGAVGVAAGIEAREAGAQVIVLEKEDHLGGAAAISGGGCCMVDTPLQREKNIEDSPDLAFQDWVNFGSGSANEEWVRFYLESSSRELYQWGLDHGVRWVALNRQEGNTVPRWHKPEGGGGGLWHALHHTALERGVESWKISTAVKELIFDGVKVVGVLAEDTTSGVTQEYYASAVVMGTGGFASNIDMVRKYRPDLKEHRILEGSHVGATGDGHGIVEQAGGILTHMGNIWFYIYAIPDHRDPENKRGLVVRGMPDAIWANMQGRRFHNEDISGGKSGTSAVMAQSPAYCWAVIDGSMRQNVTVSDGYYQLPGTSNPDYEKVAELLDLSPYVKRGETLEDLARQMEVPEEAFRETVVRYNSYIDDALDREPDFGRPLADRRQIQEPPFYAFNYVPLARKNFGGVKTNLHCQVVDKHYEPIPGLYAAGELAGMAGGHINGEAGLEGTMLGPSLFSGRAAGAWAAHNGGWGRGFPGNS